MVFPKYLPEVYYTKEVTSGVVDLTTINSRLNTLENKQPEPVDLSNIEQRLSEVENAPPGSIEVYGQDDGGETSTINFTEGFDVQIDQGDNSVFVGLQNPEAGKPLNISDINGEGGEVLNLNIGLGLETSYNGRTKEFTIEAPGLQYAGEGGTIEDKEDATSLKFVGSKVSRNSNGVVVTPVQLVQSGAVDIPSTGQGWLNAQMITFPKPFSNIPNLTLVYQWNHNDSTNNSVNNVNNMVVLQFITETGALFGINGGRNSADKIQWIAVGES